MFNYHDQIQAYESEKVNLSDSIRDDLYAKREANRNRLKANIPEKIKLTDAQFIPQGSMAIRTTVREDGNDYDIDDGVWFYEEDLRDELIGIFPKSASEIQKMICEALKDDKFNKQPEIHHNCVRVFYAEGYHVDIPAYRVFDIGTDKERQELAGEKGWLASDPTEINRWFENRIQELNKAEDESGGQLRRMIRLLKRFARSRGDKWDMPNGLKLTMLSEECFKAVKDRDDEAFYELLTNLKTRLTKDLSVLNRAQKKQPQDCLTNSNNDSNMIELRNHICEALEQLQVLSNENCTKKAARKAWDWVFQSDEFFYDYDTKQIDEDANRGIAATVPTAPFVKSETRFG